MLITWPSKKPPKRENPSPKNKRQEFTSWGLLGGTESKTQQHHSHQPHPANQPRKPKKKQKRRKRRTANYSDRVRTLIALPLLRHAMPRPIKLSKPVALSSEAQRFVTAAIVCESPPSFQCHRSTRRVTGFLGADCRCSRTERAIADPKRLDL